MSRRTNFLDADVNFREQNLRFVRNELEDNMNQFFGGAKGGPGITQQQQKPPARDSLIVQPMPGGRLRRSGAIIGTGNPEVDERRQFLRQLGVNRNKARSMVKRSMEMPNFNLRDFQRKRYQLSVELGDNRQKEVDAIILREVFQFIDANKPSVRPRTPSPPRNINWYENPNSSPPRSRNTILEKAFSVESIERNAEQRIERQRSPEQQQQQQQNFPHSNNRNTDFRINNRRVMEENDNDDCRPQIDVDRRDYIYRPEERFNFRDDLERDNRSRQVDDDDRYSPRPLPVNRSSENRNDNYNNANFENSGIFNPHDRVWDRSSDFRGDSDRFLDGRNLESGHAEYVPEFRGRQMSPTPRNLHSKEPNYQRFVQMDDENEDRVFLIRDSDSEDRSRDDILDSFRSNEFQSAQQRNYVDHRPDHFEERGGRHNNPNLQSFYNNDEEFQRSDNFRQNFGPGERGEDRYSNFLNNDRTTEFLQEQNERNFNDNYNRREEIFNNGNNRPTDFNFRNRDENQFENHRFNNQDRDRGGQNPDPNEFRRNEPFDNFLPRPEFDRFNMQGRGGQLNLQNPDVNDLQRNQSLQNFSLDQRERHGPMPSNNTNRYQSNRTDIGIQSMRDEPRNNYRSGPQRTDRTDRPNPVTATITTSQQISGRPQPLLANWTGNKSSSFGRPQAVVPSQARGEITIDGNRNQVGNRANVRQPVTAQAGKDPGQIAGNKANPQRAGQKRPSETSDLVRLTIAELKQRKIAGNQRVFRIAGFEFPYMSKSVYRLPQPESKSYALAFFEQKPNYITNYIMDYLGNGSHKNHINCTVDYNSDNESIDESSRIATTSQNSITRKNLRQRTSRAWSDIYKKENYKDWHNWWKDYKWCEIEIEKQLEKFDNISLKHWFIPTYPNATNEQVINNVLKRAEIYLGKDVNNHFHAMRTIFIIMNETFLENLSKKNVEQLQDIIRYIPNDLWLFKMRSMVYLWERYYGFIRKGQREAYAVIKQWKNPCFQWLAKQAFDELKTISEKDCPEHKNLFDGFCVKSFKVNSNEKFFINVCQAVEVPAPPVDLTEEELIAILESPDPGSFRVPMSISELRTTKDRSNKTVDVCDIAINPKFLVKINKSQLFNNFFLQIVTEALSEKYNIQISTEKTITLNNRKFIGNLVPHRVRNDDVKVVNQMNSLTSSEQQQQQLVQEIDASDGIKSSKNQYNPLANSNEPLYKLRARVRDDIVDEIYAELYLPTCVSSQELSLDIGEDRILVESLRHDFIFDKFLNYRLQQERAQALFDKTSKMLQIRIPVCNV